MALRIRRIEQAKVSPGQNLKRYQFGLLPTLFLLLSERPQETKKRDPHTHFATFAHLRTSLYASFLSFSALFLIYFELFLNLYFILLFCARAPGPLAFPEKVQLSLVRRSDSGLPTSSRESNYGVQVCTTQGPWIKWPQYPQFISHIAPCTLKDAVSRYRNIEISRNR